MFGLFGTVGHWCPCLNQPEHNLTGKSCVLSYYVFLHMLACKVHAHLRILYEATASIAMLLDGLSSLAPLLHVTRISSIT